MCAWTMTEFERAQPDAHNRHNHPDVQRLQKAFWLTDSQSDGSVQPPALRE